MPNSSIVFGLGVAVKAKVLTFFCRPRFFISATMRSSRSSPSSLSSFSASSSVAADSTDFRLLVLSPDWDEWASSMMTANRLPCQFPHLVLNDRELLQRGDDDGLAVLQRLLELAAGGVDVLHDAQRLLEGKHLSLELAVQHPAVGDDDDGVEYPPLLGIVERGKLVGKPGDGLALAAPGTVLDEIDLPCPVLTGIRHQAADRIELVVTREQEPLRAGLSALVVLLLDDLDEVLHQVQHAVPAPCPFPEVGRGKTFP